MAMLPVEHLHLEHVLQTVSVLESVVLRSFGPEGGQVLFIKDTGQAMLSRSGRCILSALQLEHPVAKVVVQCVLKHSNLTGDGSKTFIILLASLLRMIQTMACKEPTLSRTYTSRKIAEAATARQLADELLAFAFERLEHLIAVGVVPYGCNLSWENNLSAKSQLPTNSPCVQRLLTSFYHSRLSRIHCTLFSDLTCDLLSHWKFNHRQSSLLLNFLNENFPALHTPVSGFPVSYSRLVVGQVIHRDFATPCHFSENQPVKAVCFSGYLQPKILNSGEVLVLEGGQQGEEGSIVEFKARAEKLLDCVITNLKSLGVSVLLFALKQSHVVQSLAQQAGMCVVECVSEDELSLFAQLSGTQPVPDCQLMEPHHVATLTFCRPIQLGPHRYVHVDFHDSGQNFGAKPCSLVVCGPAEAQTDQCAHAFHDAIRMLLITWEPMEPTSTTLEMTWQSNDNTPLHTYSQRCSLFTLEPGCVIPAGGTFEFLLNRVILQHISRGLPVISKLLADTLLNVAQQLYSSPQCFLQIQARLLSSIQTYTHIFSPSDDCIPRDREQRKYCLEEDDIVFISNLGLESVCCKYQLLLAVLQCVSSLLKVDAVLHTHRDLHTLTRRLANISWEETENEAED